MELCSIFCNNLNGKRTRKRTDTCVRVIESLCCMAETNTTLLINYALICNKNFFKNRKELFQITIVSGLSLKVWMIKQPGF